MKNFIVFFLISMVWLSNPVHAQKETSFDVLELAKSANLLVINREVSEIREPGYAGIRLSKAKGEGIAWINGLEFSEGSIEFDVRGENLKQHSFVGIAFHGADTNTFDAIYLRPFQFVEKDETLRKRSIQYIALPGYHWRSLRESAPGKYENSIEPSPDPNAWIHMRVVIEGDMVSTYINGSNQPSLVIQKPSTTRQGLVGFYTGDTSGGDFANLVITTSR